MGRRQRRPRGEGSVWESSGTWFAEVVVGHDEDGNVRRKRVQGMSQREVVEKLHALQSGVATSTLPDQGQVTVATYLAAWLASSKAKLRATTHARYESLVRLHVLPHVGRVQIAKLQPLHVQSLYRHAEAAELSASSRRQLHAVLHRAFGQAVKQNYLVRNPCDAVEKPRPSKGAMRTLSVAEARKLEDVSKGERLHALFVLALRTGMRQGEIFGLQWEDVDTAKAALFVRHSLEELNGKHALVETKTKKGRRVDLDKACVDALKAHRKAMLAEGHPGPWVFCDEDGGPLRKSNVQRRVYKPLLKAAGMSQDVRFHDLRHTHATLALQAGVHPKVVQERLGHSSIMLTLDTYSHVVPSMQREAADKVGALLDG